MLQVLGHCLRAVECQLMPSSPQQCLLCLKPLREFAVGVVHLAAYYLLPEQQEYLKQPWACVTEQMEWLLAAGFRFGRRHLVKVLWVQVQNACCPHPTYEVVFLQEAVAELDVAAQLAALGDVAVVARAVVGVEMDVTAPTMNRLSQGRKPCL